MTIEVLEKPVPELVEEKAEKTCVHHWIIEPPDGPVSQGICQKCGTRQEFQNFFPYSTWENGKTDNERAKSLLDDWGI